MYHHAKFEHILIFSQTEWNRCIKSYSMRSSTEKMVFNADFLNWESNQYNFGNVDIFWSLTYFWLNHIPGWIARINLKISDYDLIYLSSVTFDVLLTKLCPLMNWTWVKISNWNLIYMFCFWIFTYYIWVPLHLTYFWLSYAP
jgi:hypothetical protein